MLHDEFTVELPGAGTSVGSTDSPHGSFPPHAKERRVTKDPSQLLSSLCVVWLGLAFDVALAQALPAAQDVPYLGPIQLQVDATDVDHQVLRVHETLPVRPGRVTLLYPQWIPGNHGPTNMVKRLTGLRIEAAGSVLAWHRNPDHLHAFVVDVPAGVSELSLDFIQVLPTDATGDDAILGHRLADLQWQGVVLYPAGHYSSRIEVDPVVRFPKGWQAGTALRPLAGSDGAGSGEWRFERVSLETLIDSPVFAGRHFKRVPLDDSAEQPVALNLFAEDPAALETTAEAIQAHRNLVPQFDRLFGARHFAHYDVLLALSEKPRGPGLEHHQSSENSAKSDYFKNWSKTSFQRYMVPHEFAHSWNGKFRRPADQWTPDFNTVMRNSLLWVYEGQTQYWGDVVSVRAGMVPLADMLEVFAGYAAYHHDGDAGRRWRSLQSTTDDPVTMGRQLPVEWPDWQRSEDYYVEGALIWLDVDTRIREMSGGQRSLDDFARAFFGGENGRVTPLLYTFDDVVRELQRVQPYDWAADLRRKLDTVDAPPPTAGLERAGWRLVWSERQSDYRASLEAFHKFSGFRYSLGLTIGESGKISVTWDGPAYRAGLTNGLTLLAVNRRTYKPEVLRDAITAAKSTTEPIELLLKDGDEYRIVGVDYHGGLRYPGLERIPDKPDLLTAIFSPR
jgi:predicted metalloprotease with PDZ domain